METKVCTKCNKELSIDNFSKCNKAKDGLYSWCRECHSKYRQANKQHRNQYKKQFNNQFKGYYLYIIQDKQDKIVYVGQTSNYYTRLTHHLYENVDSTKELFANGDWGCIQYLNVEHIVSNEIELRALENELIELYEPRLNTLKNVIRDIDEDRLFSIVTTLHSMNNEWEIFRTNNN